MNEADKTNALDHTNEATNQWNLGDALFERFSRFARLLFTVNSKITRKNGLMQITHIAKRLTEFANTCKARHSYVNDDSRETPETFVLSTTEPIITKRRIEPVAPPFVSQRLGSEAVHQVAFSEPKQALLHPQSPLGSVSAQAIEEDNFQPVFIHAGRAAQLAAQRMNARAFTIGSHIFVGEGEYNPGTMKWESLLAHEIAHVHKPLGLTTKEAQEDENEARRVELRVLGGEGVLEHMTNREKVPTVVVDLDDSLPAPAAPFLQDLRFRGRYPSKIEPLFWHFPRSFSSGLGDRGSSQKTDKLPGTAMEARAEESSTYSGNANAGILESRGSSIERSSIAIAAASKEPLTQEKSQHSQANIEREQVLAKEQLFDELLIRLKHELRFEREMNGIMG